MQAGFEFRIIIVLVRLGIRVNIKIVEYSCTKVTLLIESSRLQELFRRLHRLAIIQRNKVQSIRLNSLLGVFQGLVQGQFATWLQLSPGPWRQG